MATNYLYIDDNLGHVVDGQISAFNIDKTKLLVEHRQPIGDWEKERAFFLTEEFEKKYDGLILDLRLDDEVNINGNKSNYKGTSLAQELRTLSTEGKIKEVPIVLLSATEKITESLDNTGEDLFDLKLSKEKLNESTFDKVRLKLIALANGYKTILAKKNMSDEEKRFESLFAYSPENIDKRFLAKLNELFNRPTHSLASFIIKNLFSYDGILISEHVLAARLGVDIEKSKDWNKLVHAYNKANYSGIYSDGWKRWWSNEIEIISKEFLGNEILRELESKRKVEILKEVFKIDLVEAEKLPSSQSSSYWTICRGSLKPLDPVDGLLITNQDNLYPWQEKKYISIDEALNRKNKEKWQDVSALEYDRLERLKKIHSRERK